MPSFLYADTPTALPSVSEIPFSRFLIQYLRELRGETEHCVGGALKRARAPRGLPDPSGRCDPWLEPPVGAWLVSSVVIANTRGASAFCELEVE